MSDELSNTIARIKLSELERLHQRLSGEYSSIESKAASAKSLLERYQILRNGLAEIRFATKPLHPIVQSLGAIDLAIAAGSITDSTLRWWTDRLTKEVSYGKLSAATSHLYGILISEKSPDSSVRVEQSKTQEKYFQTVSQPYQGNPESFLAILERAARHLQFGPLDETAIRDTLFSPVSLEELKSHLFLAQHSEEYSNVVREQAHLVAQSPSKIAEVSSVLTIWLNDYENWHFLQPTTTHSTVFIGQKYRTVCQYDLLTTLWLQVIGARLGSILRTKLEFQDHVTRFPQNGIASTISFYRKNKLYGLFFANVPAPGSKELPSVSVRYDNVSFHGDTSFQDLLRCLTGEIFALRVLSPEQPIYVLQTDLASFYPSIPHSVIDTLLRRIGLPTSVCTFINRLLPTSYVYNDTIITTNRGLGIGQLLSSVLSDALLRVLDAYLIDKADSYTIRRNDDMFLLSNNRQEIELAWQTIQDFCTATGLKVNAEKTATECIDGKNDLTLSQRPVTWRYLRLTSSGQWVPDVNAIAEFSEDLRNRLNLQQTAAEMVRGYNHAMFWLIAGLAPTIALNDTHLDNIATTMGTFERHLFGENTGVIEKLQDRAIQLLPTFATAIQALPKAWFYWPITAGGFGVVDTMSVLQSFMCARQLRKPVGVDIEAIKSCPEAERQYRFASQIGNQYMMLTQSKITPQPPPPSPAMEGLLNDFIQRGSEVQGKTQTGLRAHWKWTLYTYGPMILDFFGSFRFMLSELVPVPVAVGNHTVPDSTDSGTDNGQLF